MRIGPLPQDVSLVTLQTVLDRLSTDTALTVGRKRDLRSAVTCFAKLKDQLPGAIPLDLADIRQCLDRMVPARAKISPKRWANIRSDLAAAIDASRLRPILKTAELKLDQAWTRLLADADPRIAHGLSRFARWASFRRIAPEAVDIKTIERFVAELQNATLVRNLRYFRRFVAKRWDALVAANGRPGLRPVSLKGNGRALGRIAWHSLPASLRADIDYFLHWASMPDPLADGARARALGQRTLRLQQQHLHSAASAAVAAGIAVEQLTSLATLVQPDTFRTVLRHLWQQDGRKLSAYTHGIAITLLPIASEWVKLPAETIATLKTLRKKLGTLPSGLTEKNEAVLRTFDDPRLLAALVNLPDQLWRQARRSHPAYAFVALQTGRLWGHERMQT